MLCWPQLLGSCGIPSNALNFSHSPAAPGLRNSLLAFAGVIRKEATYWPLSQAPRPVAQSGWWAAQGQESWAVAL